MRRYFYLSFAFAFLTLFFFLKPQIVNAGCSFMYYSNWSCGSCGGTGEWYGGGCSANGNWATITHKCTDTNSTCGQEIYYCDSPAEASAVCASGGPPSCVQLEGACYPRFLDGPETGCDRHEDGTGNLESFNPNIPDFKCSDFKDQATCETPHSRTETDQIFRKYCKWFDLNTCSPRPGAIDPIDQAKHCGGITCGNWVQAPAEDTGAICNAHNELTWRGGCECDWQAQARQYLNNGGCYSTGSPPLTCGQLLCPTICSLPEFGSQLSWVENSPTCNIACPPRTCGQSCSGSQSCVPGLTCSGGTCKNLSCPGDDDCSCSTCFQSCGANDPCPSGQSCLGGICRNPSCQNVSNCTCPAQASGNGATCIYTNIELPDPAGTISTNASFNGTIPLGNTGTTTWNPNLPYYYLKPFNSGYFPNNITLVNGLIGFWKLNETSGTGVIDGAGSHPGAASTADSAGENGRFLNNSYVSIPEASPLPPLVAKKLSISLWTKPNSLTGGKSIINRRTVTDVGGYKVETSLDHSGRVTCSFYINGDWRSATTANAMIYDNWHHIVCAYDGTKITAALNNQRVTEDISGTINTPTAYTIIGKNVNSDNYYFGTVREVGMWERALSIPEIDDLYTGGSDNYKIDTSLNNTWGTNLSVQLGINIAPGSTANMNITNKMIAPSIPNTYANFWKLQQNTRWIGPTCGTSNTVTCATAVPTPVTLYSPPNNPSVKDQNLNAFVTWNALTRSPNQWGAACSGMVRQYQLYVTPTSSQINGANPSAYTSQADPNFNTAAKDGPVIVDDGIKTQYTSATNNTISNSTTYHWRVVAYNGYGYSVSAIRSFTTKPQAWYQVTGGDVTANKIQDTIPTGVTSPYEPYIILSD